MTTLKLRSASPTPLTAADFDENMLRLHHFDDLAALLADEERDYDFYAPGATIVALAEGFRYEVAASGATNHHLTTAAGLKLYVLPGDDGVYNFLAFSPAGDDDTDDWSVFDKTLKALAGKVLRVPRRTYFLSKTLEIWHQIKLVAEPGARLRFPPGTPGVIVHHLWSAGRTAINARPVTAASLLTYQAGLVKHRGQVYSAAPGTSSALLAAQEPGTGPRWVHLRAVEGRDSSVPAWTGTGNYAVIVANPGDLTNHHFRIGTYVLCQQDGFYYRVANPEAEDHDALTMFDVKLYIVDPADYPSYTTAAGTIIDGITVDGTEASGGPADGIYLRITAHIRNVTVENFSRDGVRVVAAVFNEAPWNPEVWGNANCFSIENLVSRNNGESGYLVAGSDANGGTVLGGEFYGNGRKGLHDISFLGNTYVGCRTEGNGLGTSAGNSGGRSSVVSHGGNLYRAKFLQVGAGGDMSPAQTALLVSTIPGTNAAVWETLGVGGPSPMYPAWQSGQPVGAYFFGAGIFSGNGNARTAWLGCRTGEDEAGNVFNGGSILALGGHMPRIAVGGQVSAENGGHLWASMASLVSGDTSVSLGAIGEAGAGYNTLLAIQSHNAAPPFRLKWQANDIRFDYANAASPIFLITGEGTALNFGTSSPIPQVFTFTRGYAIGQGNNARRHWISTVAPASGAWARGDIVYNQNPSAGGHLGWICVTSGTPGTWKGFGAIAN